MSGLDDQLSGLTNERTTMAWQRTALAFVAAGALVARQSHSAPIALPVLAGVVVVAGWMLVAAGRRYSHRGGALRAGDPVVAVHHVATTAVAATALAVASLAIVAT